MIDHVSSYATDFAASQKFYDAVFATLGYERNVNMTATWDSEFPERRMCAYGRNGKPTFWLIEVKEAASPRHIAFGARDKALVEEFYRAGLDAGGSDNGAPGPREHYHPGYYGAFLLDPDGNNVEAVHHTAP